MTSPDESLDNVKVVRADNAEDTVEAGVNVNPGDLTQPRHDVVMSPLRGLHQGSPGSVGAVTDVDIKVGLSQEELQ